MKDILLIPNIKIHNANALSSPYTVGFPAITAWLGFMHALERKLQNTKFSDIKFNGLIVSCLDAHLHTYKGKGDYVSSIVATSNPLDKTGKRPSFIEEARIDLEVSIAIECTMGVIDYEEFASLIDDLLPIMKIASGDLISVKAARHLEVDEQKPQKLARLLMPGYCLVSRQDLMQKSMKSGKDAIDAMLDYLKTTRHIEQGKDIKINRKKQGWIVPISIGYQGISELKIIKNQRDAITPHKFAESIVTLGEFKMPHHFDSLDEMMWRYQADTKNDLYLCNNNSLIKNRSKL